MSVLNYKFDVIINFLPKYSSDEIFSCIWNEKLNHPKRLDTSYNQQEYSSKIDLIRLVTKGFPGNTVLGTNSNLPLISRRLWLHILFNSNIIDSIPEDDEVIVSKTKPNINKLVDESKTGKNSAGSALTWDKLSKDSIEKIVGYLTECYYPVKGMRRHVYFKHVLFHSN